MDMQDTPRYEAYEAGSEKFAQRGAASRTLVEGTVPRGFLREDSYFYTGRMEGGSALGAGATGGTGQASTGSARGGTGSAAPLLGAQGAGQSRDENVRGNVAQDATATAAAGPDVFPIPVDLAAIKRGRERFEAFCAMCHGMAGDGDGMIPRRGYQRPPSFHDDRLQEGQSAASHFFDVITNGFGAMPAYDYMIPPEDRWKIIAYVRALQLSRKLKEGELSPEERAKVAAGQTQAGGEGGRHQRPQEGGERH